MKAIILIWLTGMFMAQCSAQNKKAFSDFESGKEFMVMLQQKTDEEKKRVLTEESQLADSTLLLMKSFKGDDAVIFDTPKDDEIKQPRNVEKVFEERTVRKTLMD